MRTSISLPVLLLGILPAAAALALGACARPEPSAAQAASRPDVEPRLERVVMLMRHGVRPPTREKVSPDGTHDRPWPQWTVGLGELTPHGHTAISLLGTWERRHWAGLGLLPEEGCPLPEDVAFAASAKSRTQATARAFLEGMFPGCEVPVQFPAGPEEDTEFHPFDTGAAHVDTARAMAESRAMLPDGQEQGLVAEHGQRLALLEQALGCCSPSFCKTAASGSTSCGLDALPAEFESNDDGRPKVGDLLGTASTVSQTFLLEYLEGFPMDQVAWGRLSREQIGDLLEFHRVKFQFEARPLHVAAHAAAPLARRMVAALRGGPRLNVLVGHDTNIAQLGGLLDLHWQVPDYPRDDPPPGGALGFALFSTPDGGHSVRAFYRSQTMNQVRELQTLDGNNPAYFEYLPIPGCETPCRLEDFGALIAARIAAGD